MVGANFTGYPNQVDADRLDYWMMGLFGAGIALSPISRAAMGALLVPAVFILLYRFFKTESFNKIWSYRKTVFGGMILTVFAWFFLTSFMSLDVGKSIQVTIRTFAMILIAVTLYRYVVRRKGLALHGLRVGLFVFVIWALVGNYFFYFDTRLFLTIFYEWLNITPRLVFYKNDSALALVFLATSMYFGLSSFGVKRWFYLGLFVVLVLFIYADGHIQVTNKSAMAGNVLGIIAAVFLIAISYLSLLWRKILVVAVFAVALLGTVSVMERLAPIVEIGDTPAPTLPYPDHHRQVIWSFVYDKFQENPFLGVGIDAISKTEHANTKLIFFKGQEYVPSHPHNWVLEDAAAN